jgi:hypothetical protein
VCGRSKPASFNGRDKSGHTSEAINFLILLASNDRSRDAIVLPGAHGHFDNALPEMGTPPAGRWRVTRPSVPTATIRRETAKAQPRHG